MLGHSRGAAVAALLAGTFPERVDRLVLIEGAHPIMSTADEAPDNLAKAILESRSLRAKAGRVFPDRETALAQRVQGFTPVEIETAALLATRSLREVSGGFQWHADQRLKANSEVRLTAEQAAAFVRRVRSPAMLFLAERSPFAHRPEFQALVAEFPSLETVTLPGGHHMHMEGGEREIAARLERFLEKQTPSEGSQ
jgi:pimeloyl-ACP methyl ester carboxylesterase